MTEKEQMSFTAASTFPAKLFHCNDIIYATRTKRIIPIHVQLVITNRCNLNCRYCSCSERDKTEQLPTKTVIDIMTEFRDQGCKAVTITGGGEPLLHPQFEEIVTQIHRMGIKIGLVTNGIKLPQIRSETLNLITWCRISHDDDRRFDANYEINLRNTTTRARDVDWAFSYVLTNKPNYDTISKVIEFANRHNFTHVRIVSDLLDLEAVEDMSDIKAEMIRRGIDDSIVVYQGRKDWVKGTRNCYMSLLKPTVATNGYLYPCCGAQYAEEEPSRNYGETMRLCHWTDINEIWKHQDYFNGSICEACYYMDYNEALKIMISDLKHKEFV